MARNESKITEWDIETDVVVVGFGGAGACSAIEAFDFDAEVLVIEKQDEDSYYSNTKMSGGSFHSPDPSGDKDALTEYARAMFSGDNLPWKLEGELPPNIAQGLAEKWAEYSPQNIAWLQNLDSDFEGVVQKGPAFPEFPGAEDSKYQVVRSTYTGELGGRHEFRTEVPKAEKQFGEAFFQCLLEGISSRDIPIHWETTATEFVVDDDGAVVGIVTEQEGAERTYKSGAVILTTGGFEYNKDLRLNFLEGPGVEGWAFFGSPANTGDGIEMAMEIGSSLSKVGKAASRVITAIPKRKHGLKMGLYASSIGRPNAIVVDNRGRRYTSERSITKDPSRYFFYKRAVSFDIEQLVYPRIPSWLIFDEQHRKQWTVVGQRQLAYHNIEWGDDNSKAIENGWILQANQLNELAEQIQGHPDNCGWMESENLRTTIDTYNRYCDDGVDEEFGSNPENMAAVREPPFYAMPLYPGGPNTKGGIMANENREVLNVEMDPIPSLYTAGEISSAFKFVYQGGGNLTECIVFGRIAGENAAKHANS